MNVDMHETALWLKFGTCFHRIVEKISDDNAEIHIGHGKGGRDLRLCLHLNLFAFHQRYFAVQYSIRHGIAGLQDGINL